MTVSHFSRGLFAIARQPVDAGPDQHQSEQRHGFVAKNERGRNN